MVAAVDFEARYALSPDLLVIERDATTVQLGTERPRRMLLVDAPPGAATVLAHLDGTRSAGQAIADHDGDPLLWHSVLQCLLTAELLVAAPDRGAGEPRLSGERLALTHRYGTEVADRALTARSDALVVIDGTGPVAEAIAVQLAAAGIGHVHQRRPRPREAAPRRADRAAKARPAESPVSAGTPVSTMSPVMSTVSAARTASTMTQWRAAPATRTHRPASQVRPTVVVLAESPVPDFSRAAELVTLQVPHLAVAATQARILVGPLVLPGRSACLNCIDRARQDADPGWGAVLRRLRQAPPAAASVPAMIAAGHAAEQVLELIDGLRQPAAVGTILERPIGEQRVERHRWHMHPDCRCRQLGVR